MQHKQDFYSEDSMSGLTDQEKIQLPFYVKMTFAVIGIFSFIIAILAFLGQIESAVFLIFGITFIFLSFVFFKKGNIKKGTSMATIGILVAQSVVTFFLQFGSNPYGLYRILAFALFLYIAKYFLSSSTKEIFAYAFVSFMMFLGKAFLSYGDILQEDLSVYYACIVIGIVCYVFTTMLFLGLFQMLKDLSAFAEKGKDSAQSALVQITGVLSESKQGLEVGNILSQEAEGATNDAQRVVGAFGTLKNSCSELNASVEEVLSLFIEVEKGSTVMLEGTRTQAESISESSAALTEISTNLSSINEIASQRSQNMNELLNSLKSQKSLIQEALFEVQKVKESSSSISSFIHTVEDISNQTGLLAMNASIEAAHAGQAGKGFAVIAQEIRKLSEETSKNAAYIGDVLSANEQTVETAANAVISFASQADKSTEELQGTIEALDGILLGISEMDIGTRSVMNSLQGIVETSKTTNNVVDGVSEKIIKQRELLDIISVFSHTVDKEVNTAREQITKIQEALQTIKETSGKNVEVSQSVNDALKNINI